MYLQRADQRHRRSGFGIAKIIAYVGVVALFVLNSGASLGAPPTPKLCVPNATGVPYWSGAPDWWSTYSDPNQERLAKSFSNQFLRTEDPRWRGALGIGYGMGATEPAEFRALYNASDQHMLLSWSVKAIAFNAGDTSVVIGLKRGTAAAEVVRVRINASTTVSAGQVQPKPPVEGITTYLAFSAFNETGGSIGIPSWASAQTRVWIKPATMTSQAAFTLQIRVPIASGTNFRMWYSMQPSVPLNGDPGLVSFTWPKGPTLTWSYYETVSPAGRHIPAASTWGEFALGQQSGCAGISLADSDIGVRNTQFPGQRTSISITVPNTFYALPRNEYTQAMDLSQVTATFYFANWGSQRGELTGSSWSTLTANLVNQPTVSIPPATSIEAGVATNPVSVPSMTKAQISPLWTLSQAEKCKFFVEGSPTQYLAEAPPGGTPGACTSIGALPPALNPHGCMMVKLNGPVEFLRDSGLTNMNFQKASSFARGAEIRTAPDARDVYLFVDKRNMPRLVDRKADPQVGAPTPSGTPGTVSPGGGVVVVPIGDQLKDIHTTLARNRLPQMSVEELAAVMPTYVVHGFHTVGSNKIFIDGRAHIPLDQQTSFGQFIWHEGPLFGWIDSITGAQTVGPQGPYLISVPAGGAANVNVAITAAETEDEAKPPTTPDKDKNCGRLRLGSAGGVLAAFVVTGFVWKRRRKPKE
jgi:hypothetical protein